MLAPMHILAGDPSIPAGSDASRPISTPKRPGRPPKSSNQGRVVANVGVTDVPSTAAFDSEGFPNIVGGITNGATPLGRRRGRPPKSYSSPAVATTVKRPRKLSGSPLGRPKKGGLSRWYRAGQRFGRHIDESVDIGEGKCTLYTLLIYLSGGPKSKPKVDNDSQDSLPEILVGGETVFYGPRNSLVAEVPPTEGMALVHIHGDKCMLHEARNVIKGIKYILRSDVVFA